MSDDTLVVIAEPHKITTKAQDIGFTDNPPCGYRSPCKGMRMLSGQQEGVFTLCRHILRLCPGV